MKSILFAALMALSNSVFAQLDGTWLKKSLDAYSRTEARTASEQDTTDALFMLGYLNGVLGVQRNNNLGAVVVFSTLGGNDKEKKPTPEGAAAIRVASMFAPLLRMPDDASPEQLIAIVKNYVNAHPEKWKSPAHTLITDGLALAFPKKGS